MVKTIPETLSIKSKNYCDLPAKAKIEYDRFMQDLYQTLEIHHKSSQAEVKKSYRALAKKLHPDTNKDDPIIAERFKAVSAAYSILGDENLRTQYDRGEIDENGNVKANSNAYGRNGFTSDGSHSNSSGFHRTNSRTAQARQSEDFDFESAEDLFSNFFNFSRSAGKKSSSTSKATKKNKSKPKRDPDKRAGLDISYQITVNFEDSITGGKKRLNLNDGRAVEITIPAGIQDGQVIRLAGQGGHGIGGGVKGNALIEVRVPEHAYYRRDGLDIHLELPITVNEAILGGDIAVPTPKGRLTVRIPRSSSSGRCLRLKDKGVKRGDKQGHMYVTLKIVLPEKRDLSLERLVKQWDTKAHENPRKKAGLA